MKTLSTTLLVLLSLTLASTSYCQESQKYSTNHVFVLWDLNEDLTHLEVDAEVTISNVSAYITIDKMTFSMAEKSCFYKGEREVQNEGNLTRTIIDCVSGGIFKVTSKPGKTKFSFLNSTGKHKEGFTSGVIYTDFAPKSTSELLLW